MVDNKNSKLSSSDNFSTNKAIDYQALFEYSKDAIMTLAPPDWSFTNGNKAALELFKAKDLNEFTSNPPWKYSPKFQPDKQPSADKAKANIMKAIKEGSNSFEWTHQKLDGTDFSATVLLTKVTTGKEEFLQATVRDVTREKAKMLELEKANKLMVGRELKMLELKKEIKKLEKMMLLNKKSEKKKAGKQ